MSVGFNGLGGENLPKVGSVVTAEDECTSAVGVVNVVDLHVVWADVVVVGMVEAGLWDPSPFPSVVGALGWREVFPEDRVNMGRQTILEERWLSETREGWGAEEDSCGRSLEEGGSHNDRGQGLTSDRIVWTELTETDGNAPALTREQIFMAIIMPLYFAQAAVRAVWRMPLTCFKDPSGNKVNLATTPGEAPSQRVSPQ